ncbi:MAG TPA: acyl-CoA synthetase [Usitatibacter sp.]|nr:acyl-CoA synthetase [Usitatibacter sp.]
MSAASSSRRGTSADWTRRPERGSAFLIRFIVWFARRAGRGPARALLRIAAAYFFATGGAARRASRESLRRALGREPTLAERFGLLFAFASTVLDRVYFVEGRFDLFDIAIHGAELFDERGAVLMGGHLGSFEALHACGHARRAIAMAMYEDNAHKVQSALAAIAPEMQKDIVPLGRIDSMLRLEERLASGALVGVLADRTLGEEAVLDLPFLGALAPFPTGPMRMAAALRARVLFMAGLYRGGNRYEIRFEPLADFTALGDVSRAERESRVNEAVARYAACLERHCRLAPDNFFNFHRFWR